MPILMNDRTRAIGLLALGVVASASAWPVMKYGIVDATPVWYAAGRAMLAAATGFALLAALGKLRAPTRADLPVIASVGTLQLCLFFALINLGVALLPAGRSVILAYTTTLWVVPLAGPLIGEWPHRRQLLGVAIGFGGVGLLLAPAFVGASSSDASPLGYLYLLGAALVWALAILHSRRHRWHLSPLQVMPWQMLWATCLLFPLALLFEPQGGVAMTARALVPLAFLGIVAGPTITWTLTSVAKMLPSVAASLGFLVTPVIGVALSAWALGEPVGLDLVLGGVLVLVGAGVAIVMAPKPVASTGPQR